MSVGQYSGGESGLEYKEEQNIRRSEQKERE